MASRCAYVQAQVGVATSQNITDPRLGPRLLDALAAGADAQAALDAVVAATPHSDWRQLAVVDSSGASAAWSGAKSLGVFGDRTGHGWAAAGNMLASEDVLDAVGAAFVESEERELEERLLTALAAGLAAGGEAGPLGSAGLLVADAVEWPVTNLRVDWALAPARTPSLSSPVCGSYGRRNATTMSPARWILRQLRRMESRAIPTVRLLVRANANCDTRFGLRVRD